MAKEVDDPEAFVVTLVCDWGERYLSKAYDDDWMRENGFLKRRRRTTAGELVQTKEDSIGGLISIDPTTPVRMALSTITTHDIGQLPVLLDGSCVGSVVETHLMAQVIADPALLGRPVEAVMQPPFPVLPEHEDAEEVRRLLARGNAACLVRDRETFAGIVTRYDVVRAMTS